MKHLLRAAMVLLLTAGLASAAAIADNDQFQGQFDGGAAFAAPGFGGFIGGAGAGQIGGGFAAASIGDGAIEQQAQQQIQFDGENFDNGDGNYAGSAWQTVQNQESGSFVSGGGVAANGQAQGMVGGAAGVTFGGVAGVAGSAGVAGGAGGSFALGAAAAYNTQDQQFNGVYEQQSNNANGGWVHQNGEQEFGTATATGAFAIGAGGAAAGVVQAGGTVAGNNGVGTYMEGHGTAVGAAGATSGALGIATAEASAFGTQTHEYNQGNFSADGSSSQYQEGMVQTTVIAVSP